MYVTIPPAMSIHRLLLASQSPRRRELLALTGLSFETANPNTSEIALAGESPVQLAVRLSQAKAYSLMGRTRLFIIACDTVVALNGDALGKPRDTLEAALMLRRLRKTPHTVYTAVTLLEPESGQTRTEVAETYVVMRAYSDAEIDAYIATGDPMDKAGAYGIQNPYFAPVLHVDGCYANVIGLPLCHLARALQAYKITPPCYIPYVCQAHIQRRCTAYANILCDPL